jgi:hypothetical protein
LPCRPNRSKPAFHKSSIGLVISPRIAFGELGVNLPRPHIGMAQQIQKAAEMSPAQDPMRGKGMGSMRSKGNIMNSKIRHKATNLLEIKVLTKQRF